MRTDEEIKKFIDEREVLTRTELSKFIYGYKQLGNSRSLKWWLYVLETKDLTKLKEFAKDKIKAGTNSYLINIKQYAIKEKA